LAGNLLIVNGRI